MSNRPKANGKIQYGTPAPGAPGAPKAKSAADSQMGVKIAIGVAVVAILGVIVFAAVKDNGSTSKVSDVAFQRVTVTGDALPAFPEDTNPATDPAVGLTIPTITGKSFDGSKVEIKPGKPQLIVLVAHWCPHCQAEVPLLVDWMADGTIPSDVDVIAVSTSANEAQGNFPPASWLEKEEWNKPVLVDSANSSVLKAFGAQSYPSLLAVDASGKVTQRASGELPQSAIAAMVQSALGGATAPADAAPADDVAGTTIAP